MESVPERGVAFFGRDTVSFNEGLAVNVDLPIVLKDILLATNPRTAVVVYEVV